MILEGINNLLPNSINDIFSWDLHSKLSFGRPYIPLIGCSPYNFRLTTAWHIKPEFQYPHTLKYRCLKAIIDNDINDLKQILDHHDFHMEAFLDPKYRLTPLNLAVLFDRKNIVKYLILRGADIEALDGRGETPLSIAVRNCSYNSLETLLENGCEIEKKDLFGFNVIDKARMRGFDSLRLFLEKKAEERKEILEKRLKEGKKLWDLMKFDIRFSWEENDQVFKEIVIGRKIIRKNPIIYPFNDFKGLYNVSILQEFDD